MKNVAQENLKGTVKKQPFVITGTMVMRAVQVLVVLMLVWVLVADILKIQSFDDTTITLLICSLGAMEAGLQGLKKKKEETS